MRKIFIHILVYSILIYATVVCSVSAAEAWVSDNGQKYSGWAKKWYTECEKRVDEGKKNGCNILFVGDSITMGFATSSGRKVWSEEFAPMKSINFGIGGDKTQDILYRIENMDISTLNPKVTVLLIGTNNFEDTSEDIAHGVQSNVDAILKKFTSTHIILVSVLPSTRGREKMKRVNKIIAHYAQDKRVSYLDMTPLMPPRGDTWKGLGKDRLHLNSEGYQMYGQALKKTILKILEDKTESLSASVTDTTKPMLVFILAGQSNMLGQGASKDIAKELLQFDRVQMLVSDDDRPVGLRYKHELKGNVWNCDVEKIHWVPFELKSDSFGPEIGFIHQLQKSLPNRNIGIIKYAVNATSLNRHWLGEGHPIAGKLLPQLIEVSKKGIELERSELGAILWMQGESDA